MPLRPLLAVALCAAIHASATPASQGARKTSLFDDGWKFYLGQADGAEQAAFDDSAWRPVTLPHDWSIEGPFDEKAPGGKAFGYLPGGIGWYRKEFVVPAEDKGKKVSLEFDGVYENAEVWLNGARLGKHGYGFTGFAFDLTPGLKFGEKNVIAVRADNLNQPNCRWYTGSGIYRDVRLTVTGPLHVSRWGTYITTPEVGKDRAVVRVRTTVTNGSAETKTFALETHLRSGENTAAKAATPATLSPGETKEFSQDLTVANPSLWSPEDPHLYSAETRLVEHGRTADAFATPFGIRTIAYQASSGFSINGKSTKMKGVCLHNDGGSVGTAVPLAVWERRLQTLKDIGCNAIRCSHNPPAPEFLDLCDRLGFLVIDEAFDKWEGKYARHFGADWKEDVLAMVCRDRNHPSVVLWSVGNENMSDDAKGPRWTPAHFDIYRKLADTVRATDPTRPVTAALKPFGPPKENPTKEALIKELVAQAEVQDVVSLNYMEHLIEDLHAALPDKVLIASEAYMYYRGEGTDYKSTNDNNPWFDAAKHPYVAGQFLWAGIDYIGESEGWPAKGWGASLLDIAGFRKDRSYWHESVWSDKPMVHVAVFTDGGDYPQKEMWDWPNVRSHWTFPGREGHPLKLVTYSNCDAVELFLNGESLGVKKPADFKNGTALWEVAYQPGELKAVGIKAGEPAASWIVTTTGTAERIALSLYRPAGAGARDVAQIEVSIVDADGNVVPDAAVPLTFSVEGGKLLGLDSGDLRSEEPFAGPTRKSYRGRLLAIVRPDAGCKALGVTATAPGLPEVKLAIPIAD